MPRRRTPQPPIHLRSDRMLDVDTGEVIKPGELLIEGDQIVDVAPTSVPADAAVLDVGDLTRPIGGHWTSWSVLLLRGLYRTFGVDFWPWFYIPRLIGHTLLVTLIWLYLEILRLLSKIMGKKDR